MRVLKRLSRPTIGMLLIITAGALVACGSSSSDKELIESARNYMAEDQVRAASIELKNALQTNPKNAEARYLLGKINLHVGDLASAEKEFQRALEMGWDEEASILGKMRAMIVQRKYKEVLEGLPPATGWSETARANLLAIEALANAGEGDVLKAKTIYLAAEKLDANAYDVLKISILLQLNEKQNSDAAATLNKAIELFPGDPEFMLMKAKLAALSNQNDEAIRVFEQIINDGPKGLMTLYVKQARLGLLKLAIQTGDFERVEKSREAFVESKIDDPEVNYFLAVAAYTEKNYDQAEEYLQKIPNISTSHGPTLLLSGSVSYEKRDYEKAAYYLSKYVTNYPENNKARKLLGRAYLALGQNEDAQAEFNSVLNENAEDAELIALLGLSEIRGGQVQSGITDLEKALTMASDSSSLKLQLARAYITDGQTDKAIQQLDEVLQAGGDRLQMKSLKVLAYINGQNTDMAMVIAQQMLAESPDNPDVLSLMGSIQLAAKDISAARKYFEQALEVDAGHVASEMNLARIDEQQGDLDAAKKHYLSVLDKRPGAIAVMTSLARLAARQDDEASQIKWLEVARQADKKDLVSRVALVDIYLKNENIADAEILIRELEEAQPDAPVVLAVKGKLLMAQKRSTQAETVISKFIDAMPEQDIGYYLQAQNQLVLGNKDKALVNLRKAYSLQPETLRNVILLARVEQISGNYNQAMELGDKIIRIAPDSAIGYVIMGNAMYALKQYKSASENFDKAWAVAKTRDIALARYNVTSKLYSVKEAIPILTDWLVDNAKDEVILLELGVAYLTDEQYKNATVIFEKILSLQPDNIIALNNLAWLYGQNNNPRALELAEKAYSLKPDSPGIIDTYGWVLVQQGQVAKGRKLLEQALKGLPQVPEVQFHYAVALLKSGEEQEARVMLEQLLESGKPFEGREEARKLLD